MAEQYDVVVIGGGPAGNAMASGLKAQGKTVLIVEADLWAALVLTAVVTLRKSC
ncbi:Glutathione reductase [Lactiplantibacillus plantarum subsp. plantarum]|nr:Glutathione reductase [Lactiplantibacillus plantarum subsp. plantarum]